MAKAAFRRIVLGFAATGLLQACVAGSGPATSDGPAPAPGLRAGAAQDVPAPEVFQTTDTALWDGRPSLGGIWVASPNATDPERVVMVNPANGKTVNGALFRRERENPGPTLQISSDAAEALGILAGQPTVIEVTAVRRVEPEAPAEPAEAEAEATAVAATEPAADPAATEAAAIAAAALDATGTATETAAEATGEAAEATGEAAEATAEAVAEPPARKTWKERRAEARAKREAERAARAAEKAAAEAAEAAAAGAGEGAPTAETAGVEAIETAPLDAPLDARVPEATGATGATEETGATPAPAPAEAAPEAPATGAARPIQIASFSKEENAQRAVDALAKIGITARPQKNDRGGKVVWGVVAMGDAALLARIKDAGFADAYFLQ